MSRIALSNTGSWQLKFEDTQDIRGFDALDADGNKVGEVDTMIVNTEERRVDAILLEDGTEYPARDLSIGDGVVYLTTMTGDVDGGSVTVYNDQGEVVEREAVADADYDAHRDVFRQHHTQTYATSGRAFDDDEDAYRYGYESAYSDNNRDRLFTDAEDDLRAGYGSAYAGRDYDADRDAVRYGYSSAQRGLR